MKTIERCILATGSLNLARNTLQGVPLELMDRDKNNNFILKAHLPITIVLLTMVSIL